VNTRARTVEPIVSSAHLADGGLPALSEFEFGLILVSNAFQRWLVRGMAAAGLADLSPVDVMVLHSVQHRSKPKRLADLCFVLNIEDTHVISYSVKKLERLKLVSSRKQGKEKLIAATPAGTQACERYKAIREALLVDPVASLGLDPASMSRIAGQMRTLSGYYDQAARGAASM